MQHHNYENVNIHADALIQEARSWIGTPYQHQASLKGVGADCLGLIRGIYRAFYGLEPEKTPPYSPNWAEFHGKDELSRIGKCYFISVDKADKQEGDILLFRWKEQAIPKHLAILSSPETMIHAHQGSNVCEVPLSRWWEIRIAGVYRFPDMRANVNSE